METFRNSLIGFLGIQKIIEIFFSLFIQKNKYTDLI